MALPSSAKSSMSQVVFARHPPTSLCTSSGAIFLSLSAAIANLANS